MKRILLLAVVFSMLLITPAFAKEPTQHWASDDIAFLQHNGLALEIDFSHPDEIISRGDFLSIFMGVAAAPNVPSLKDGLFKSQKRISRLEAIMILNQAMKYSDASDQGFVFADDAQIYYTKEAYIAYNAGIIKGYPDAKFRPSSELTKAQTAAIVRRIYERSHKAEGSKLEVERKFLIDANNIPYDISKADIFDIQQTYINFSPEIRVRKINGLYYSFALKLPKDTIGLARQEVEFNINGDEYDSLYAKRSVESIYKMRYQFYVEDEYVAVDIYSGNLQGLAVCEIEFDDEEAANKFVPYDWFIKDVTSDSRYKNGSSAQFGKPE